MDRRTSRLVMYGGLVLILVLVVLVVVFSPR
jgi:predicted nucleic acid-binding Zn ribbon protein